MKRSLAIPFIALALGLSGPALADEDERVDHFEGKQPESLEEAVALFREYNAKLDQVLASDSLSSADMAEIHRMSYTLENSLGMIRDQLGALRNTLEDVHLASERGDAKTVSNAGQAYLTTARTVVE
ncbi:MAG: DUF6746 family protein [Halofilum sp. (in: g-proteobacteria)]|nr:DUF6746 family protein [Halofilum sp. (in: g-proteobacteria)]